MARLVYACRFEVSSDEGASTVLQAYRAWLVRHYRERRSLPDFEFDPSQNSQADGLPFDHNLMSTAYVSEAGRVIRISWSYPDNVDQGLRWLNEVRVGLLGERTNVEHTISIESVEYNVSPARLLFGSPKVVRDLCTSATAFIGDMQVRAAPYSLQADSLDVFLSLLLSDLRKLPIIFLSPYTGGEINRLDAAQLAKNLAGVAVIVQTMDTELTWDLADALGRPLSCFDGACRIYWPGFSKQDSPRNHRLFLSSWIEQVGAASAGRAIERAIFAVAAFRFVPDPAISKIVREVEAEERQKRIEGQKSADDKEWEELALQLDSDLEVAKSRVLELEAENANLKANQQILFASGALTGDPESEARDESEMVSSVFDAVEMASTVLPSCEFLPTAFSSAKESPFQRPLEILDALRDLNGIVDAWRKRRNEKGSGGDLLQYLRERGWGKRSSMHISDTTRARFQSDYEFEYCGAKQLFEPHITLGAGDPNSCASIHFIFDQEREKMIVAHVGKHLPNTKT